MIDTDIPNPPRARRAGLVALGRRLAQHHDLTARFFEPLLEQTDLRGFPAAFGAFERKKKSSAHGDHSHSMLAGGLVLMS